MLIVFVMDICNFILELVGISGDNFYIDIKIIGIYLIGSFW